MLIVSNLRAQRRLHRGICVLLGVQSCLGTLPDGLQDFGKSGMLPICWHFRFDPCFAELIPRCVFLHRAEAAEGMGGGGDSIKYPSRVGIVG